MREQYLKKLDEKLAAHGTGLLKLQDESKLPGGVRRILVNFDHWQAEKLESEARLLAEGFSTSTASVALPAGLQRTVIREALCDLAVLDVVDIIANPTASGTMLIPFEERLCDPLNDGIVYENQPIPRASIRMSMHTVWLHAVKLSLLVTNEAQHMTSVIGQEFAAIERNIRANAGLVQELIARRICNEIQRASDSFEAVKVTAEDLSGKLTGSTSLVKTANFPIVRPYQERDLQGNNQNNPENPLTLTINGAPIPEWDGTGNQPIGIYWVIENLNLGFVRLVNQLGAPTKPTHTSGSTGISYTYATNVIKFDLKLPAGTEEYVHLDGALRAFGKARTNLSQNRRVLANFAIMPSTINILLTGARSFMQASAHTGTALNGLGDLEIIHGIPCWGTNIPCDFGRERILLGQRGTAKYVVAKPFITGEPFEAQGTNGATGAKIAYGEEYSAIAIPPPMRKKLTSVILFNSDERTAAV